MGGRSPAAAGAPAAAGPGGGRGGVQGGRQRLGALLGVYTSSGARTGTLSPPTGAMRATLTQVKADIARVEKESR